MTEYANSYQRDFVEQIVFEAVQMTKPLPADLTHRDTIPDRLNIVVAGILCDLEGDGGTEPYRLSPKLQPDVDLTEHGMRHDWLNRFPGAGPKREFMLALLQVYARAQGEPAIVPALGQLLHGLASLIEGGYELVPVLFDDNGMYEDDGLDIAPGLAAAVRFAWADRDAIAT